MWVTICRMGKRSITPKILKKMSEKPEEFRKEVDGYDRMAKYNQLLRIEDELGAVANWPGKDFKFL